MNMKISKNYFSSFIAFSLHKTYHVDEIFKYFPFENDSRFICSVSVLSTFIAKFHYLVLLSFKCL